MKKEEFRLRGLAQRHQSKKRKDQKSNWLCTTISSDFGLLNYKQQYRLTQILTGGHTINIS